MNRDTRVRIGRGTATLAMALLLAGAPPLRGAGSVGSPAGAESNAAPSMPADPMLRRILEAFDAAQSSTMTIVSGFTEERRLKLLAKPRVSRGVFYFDRPNRVRWEYLEPDRRVFVITEERYVAYYPALRRAEEVPIRKFVGKRLFRFLGLGQSSADLAKYYELRIEPNNDIPGSHLLLLSPRKRRVQERLAEMRIWVDADTFLPRRMRYSERDGDSTTITFDDLRANAVVATGSFQINLPKDIEITSTFNGFALGQQGF